MGVPGEKLWDDEKHTQDFTAVCTPTFVTPNVRANARLQYWSRRHLPVFYFFDPRDPHLLDFMMQGLWNETQTNPLGATYYSCVPYLIGPGQAMQYSFWPMTKAPKKIPGLPFRPGGQLPARQHDSHARRRPTSSSRCACSCRPIRSSCRSRTTRCMWPTRLSPRMPVATLRIPRQKFDHPDQLAFARYLRFNPWHCLPDHRPLGNQSRARKRMYDEMASFRQKNERSRSISSRPATRCSARRPWRSKRPRR